MPVLITATDTTLSHAVIGALAALGGEVRAFGPDLPVQVLRQSGVVCATGSLLDEGHLETALEQVHTVVHLGIDVLADEPERLVEEAATLASAAVGAQVRRVLVVSIAGAAPDADEPVRRAAGEAEQVLADVPCPTTIVRTSLVDTPELRAAVARTPLPSAALDNAVAPVSPADVATVVTWLDDQRDAQLPPSPVLAADGPHVVPLRDWMRVAGITPLGGVGRVVGRLRGASPLLGDVLAGPWTSPDLPDGLALAGLP